MSSIARKLMAPGKKLDPAWDLSYAKLDPSVVSDEWNVTTASYLRSFSVAAQETNPGGMFFRDDGLKMYVVGTVNDNVNEYNLSTAWDVSTASFLQLFSVAAQETVPQALFFKPDGLKMYVMGTTGDDVNEYDLSTAWDVSTASFLQLFSVATQETVPTGLFFKPDGLKMYIIGSAGDDVNEYDLSTAWDVSTASFLQLFSVAAQETNPSDVFFRDDGLKMYIIGSAGDDVNEYDLSTAWDVSTASFLQLFSVIANADNPTSVFFRPDGRKMYVLSSASNDVNEYDVSKVGRSFSVAAQEANPSEVFFKPDGLKMFIVGTTGDDVNEYHLATAWDVTTASFVQLFSVAAQETAPRGMFFRADGLKMYIVGTSSDNVNEYNLSTAWDVSTASFLQLFSVAAQEADPSAVFFRDDGLKMYTVGIANDNVNEYDLSTAWDVSTASFLQLFSVSAQETFPRGLFFKPDGLKMYVMGTTGDDVNEYHLATAWDVTTASFVQLFSVAAQETAPMGLFFRDDGLRMYIVGTSSDTVFEYIFTV